MNSYRRACSDSVGSSASRDSQKSRHMYSFRRMSGMFHHTPHSQATNPHNSEEGRRMYNLNDTTSSIAESSISEDYDDVSTLGTIPRTSGRSRAATDVEFNNVRSVNKDPNHTLTSLPSVSSLNLFRAHSGDSSIDSADTYSTLRGRERKLGKFFPRKSAEKNQTPSGADDDSFRYSKVPLENSYEGTTAPSSNKVFLPLKTAPTTSGGFASKLKRHDNLSIQTSLLPSSNRDMKSPLVRTSKELERIAGYSDAVAADRYSMANSTSLPPKSWTKYRSHHYLLHPRKDSLKSSSNSNSKLSLDGGREALYSFHPSAVNTSLSTSDMHSVLQELQQLNLDGNSKKNTANDVSTLAEDKDAIGDEAWAIFCSLVKPIFHGGRLKAPVEEINKLVYLYMKLCSGSSSYDSNDNVNSSTNEITDVSPTTSAFSPLTAPVPILSSTYSMNTSPATSSMKTITPTLTGFGRYGKIEEKITNFLRVGMSTLMNLLYYDERERTVKLRSINEDSPSKRARNHSNSLGNSPNTAVFSTNINFEKSCSLLWDTFYDKIFFYLQGVFLPLESGAALFDDLSIQFPTVPTNIPVSNIALASFRDNLVIPLYEMNRHSETEKERREHDSMISSINILNTNSSLSSPIGENTHADVDGSGSANDEAMKESYSVNLTLLQCFTILNGVQTNDTNQKIIENLMQQTREKCLIYESAVKV
ncbi:hypothetical protein FOA43_003662 [Brettanomyces nanus]|uniref:Uncharacterized protein n=1 Tax=Eeniella nana TaxID=13502 RepID=A0A875S4P8_EENNA|nr:uncharacterized protein FOA43_003662 [Brettanomyces nanus]QPG76276.1 hypothetical protein FOA43_003662 [Brettanomyces nanus]